MMKNVKDHIGTNHQAVTVYPAHTIEQKLGMDIVRKYISEYCVTDAAREYVDAMRMSADFASVLESLEQTDEMKVLLTSEGTAFSLSGLSDTRFWLKTLATPGTFIDAPALHTLRHSLLICSEVKDFFASENCDCHRLQTLTADMFDVREVVRIIDKILGPDGDVKDTASVRLAEIRREKSTIQNRISSAMRRVIAKAVADGIVEADTKPSVRDGRLVLPVPAMHKRSLSGIVHDESATGRTFFIEPGEVVELGNEQRQLEIEERHEIIKILTETATLIRPHLPEVISAFGIMYKLDFIHAKALFAIKVGGELPQMIDKCEISWHDAVHPVLRIKLMERGRTVVPLDIDLTADTSRILVISGPNAGGKSVALKTVGLNQYMVQAGILPVMDRNSRVGIFDSMFVDLGDDQSIDDDLSTYSSHLRNMKFILSHGNARSLFLIDEFGGGTEPQIGGAIAQALLAEFNKMGMWGIVTTHFQNLKQMAQETEGILNGSMMYDRSAMKPTFRLLSGTPGSSFAVEIALRTGLPRHIIDDVENIVGSDYFNVDKYLLDISRDRRYWENKRYQIKNREKHLEDTISRYEENAETLRRQRRAILEEAKQQADDIIAQSNAAVERTIREIRKSQADKEATRLAREQLSRDRHAIENETPRKSKILEKAPRPKKQKETAVVQQAPEIISVNDTVLLDSQGNPGTVLEIQRNNAVVAFGSMKLTVPVKRLSRTIRKATGASSSDSTVVTRQTTESNRQRQLAFKTEIDVRGMRADEAIQAVTYFIDDALQFNAGRVRILHGTGTGALRMAIRQYLDSVAGVVSFRDEDVRMGGAGITVVDL